MKNPLTKEAFADWCEAQGDREYDWEDCNNCAAAQYAGHLGIPVSEWTEVAPWTPGHFWYDASWAAIGKPHTFSALATRLRTGEA